MRSTQRTITCKHNHLICLHQHEFAERNMQRRKKPSALQSQEGGNLQSGRKEGAHGRAGGLTESQSHCIERKETCIDTHEKREKRNHGGSLPPLSPCTQYSSLREFHSILDRSFGESTVNPTITERTHGNDQSWTKKVCRPLPFLLPDVQAPSGTKSLSLSLRPPFFRPLCSGIIECIVGLFEELSLSLSFSSPFST